MPEAKNAPSPEQIAEQICKMFDQTQSRTELWHAIANALAEASKTGFERGGKLACEDWEPTMLTQRDALQSKYETLAAAARRCVNNAHYKQVECTHVESVDLDGLESTLSDLEDKTELSARTDYALRAQLEAALENERLQTEPSSQSLLQAGLDAIRDANDKLRAECDGLKVLVANYERGADQARAELENAVARIRELEKYEP